MGQPAFDVVKDTIIRNSLIEPGSHIVAGLSGGPDSACLFHVLAALRGEMGFRLSAVHVNHLLRPGTAEGDAAYAERLCAELGAGFYGFERDVAALAREWGVGHEEAGRRARYEAFFETAGRVAGEEGIPAGMARVAVAHSRNDQAETVLLRIIRGTGVDGLAAMPYMREGRGGFRVIRPLLDLGRDDIEGYCAAAGLDPRLDETNGDATYRRNRVRIGLLPLLAREYNAGITGALARLASNAGEDRDYFSGIIDGLIRERGAFADGGAAVEMPLDAAAGLHPALRHRLIVRCFGLAGLEQDIGAVHLRAADALIEGGRTGKTLCFPNGYRLALRYGRLAFFREGARAARPDAGPQGGAARARLSELAGRGAAGVVLDAGGARLRVSRVPAGLPGGGAAENRLALDFGLVSSAADTVELRGRRAGDWIRPAGMDGRKKIQDLFVDAKIPARDRDGAALAAAGSEALLALCGGRLLRKTGNYAVNGDTEHVLLLEYFFD
ncbi:MAG: tRNA lysidine(34) synthetase TilS [Clostridiales Family XIII bacterium]|jgi:tRNA(Ile)-lysidine synthase|nr:tRNA lysidine(34) synthetase TilS [Clostridiales Family XIII bacterium]